jgi:hypothetical protein
VEGFEEMSTDSISPDIGTFNYIKSNLQSWGKTADNLARVAYKLETDRATQDNRFVSLRSSDVYYMLIGFALENYYKGAILAKLLESGKCTQEGKLDSVLNTHHLSQLADEAGVAIKDRLHKSYLDYITECVTWRGRYPLPTKASDIKGSITYHPPKEGGRYHILIGLDHAIPVDTIHELIDQAKTNLDMRLHQKVDKKSKRGVSPK